MSKKLAQISLYFAYYAVKFVIHSAFAYFIGAIAVGFMMFTFPTLDLPTLFVPRWMILVAIGWAIMLCGSAYVRKRAIQEEIKPLSDIEIIEPQPSQTKRFFGKDGPFERFCERRIVPIAEYAGNKWNQIADRWRELHISVKCLAVIAAGFLVGAPMLWAAGISGELGWALIPWAIGIGWIVTFIFVVGGAGILWSIIQMLGIGFVVLSELKSVCRDLPHGLVWRYRSWQLRRVARKQLRRP